MKTIQKHKRNFLYSAFLIFSVLTAASLPAHAGVIAADKSAAVVFSYQRIDDDAAQQGSLALDQFKAHIQELKTDGYSVKALPEVIDAIQSGKELPPRTIVLTFEGVWQSTLNTVVPLLTEANLPFTLFFSPDQADQPSAGHASWKEISNLKKNKLVSFGILPAGYIRLVDHSAEENAAAINKSIARYRDKMGEDAAFFAYPYGEYSSAVKKQMADYPFKAVFGQQSGVVYAGSDFKALPRFTMTDMYGDLSRFLLTANALPLPVTDMVPDDTVITQNPPHIGFTVAPDITGLSKLSCFASGQGKVGVLRPGGNRVEIRLSAPLEDRTARINCTLPDDTFIPGHGQRWRWLGLQIFNRDYAIDPAVDNAADSDDEETPSPND